MSKFYREKDPEVMKAMAKEAEEKIKTDSNWKAHQNSLPDMKIRVLSLYKDKKEWDKLKQTIQEINPEMTNSVAMMYNNIAWGMQGKSENLVLAEELSRIATEHSKKEMQQPTEKKPTNQTTKQWEKSRRERYAMFADTYAMVMYRMGEYKKGFSLTREAALDIHNGNNVNQNTTYALLAEKVLPVEQYKILLENFVSKGKANKEIKEVLQRAYIKEKGSEDGYDNYMAALEKEERLRMLEELRKTMLNNPAPAFALYDLGGKQVSLADLKGKTVIVDFWATWCGPCIASFPGMQKVATKYKNNPDVVFLFVDTWESVEDKKKNAAEFIANKKLDLHVLLDDQNKVVEQFKVEGVPTKFVIDKNGVIRFKSVGYNGNDDKLVTELTAMIELASL
jgi:thiol-disulfide isomerase/thioredoxin